MSTRSVMGQAQKCRRKLPHKRLSGPQVGSLHPTWLSPCLSPPAKGTRLQEGMCQAPWGGNCHTQAGGPLWRVPKSSGETAGWAKPYGQVPAPNASPASQAEQLRAGFQVRVKSCALEHTENEKSISQRCWSQGAEAGRETLFSLSDSCNWGN